MLLEVLRLAAATALLVVLPGWLLMRALFPRREEAGLAERFYVTLAGGILVVMLLAAVLGFLPHAGGRGHLQSLALGGLPNVELAVLGACALLAWAGIRRGSHPWLAARLPTSLRAAASTPPRGPAP